MIKSFYKTISNLFSRQNRNKKKDIFYKKVLTFIEKKINNGAREWELSYWFGVLKLKDKNIYMSDNYLFFIEGEMFKVKKIDQKRIFKKINNIFDFFLF